MRVVTMEKSEFCGEGSIHSGNWRKRESVKKTVLEIQDRKSKKGSEVTEVKKEYLAAFSGHRLVRWECCQPLSLTGSTQLSFSTLSPACCVCIFQG